MTHSARFLTKFRPANSREGFTLVELLVVIAIIATLMGLLVPTIGAVITSAKKTEAKNDAMQIVNAIRGYYTEYGRYPNINGSSVPPPAPDLIESAANMGKLLDILRAIKSGSNSTLVEDQNPRRIVFLEGKEAKNASAPKSGFSGGVWYDPWGSFYRVMMDTDYNNEVAPQPASGASPALPGTFPLRTGVIAWSHGLSTEKESDNASDLVVSWQ